MKILIVISFVFLTFNNTNGQSAFEKEVNDQIDQIFSRFEGIPGCAVGIYKHGEIAFQKGYGIANLDHDIKINPNTVFEIASVSKQFTAAAIMFLEEQGKLNLSDPIQRFLPEIPVYKEGAITIQHLLHHTSGLRDYLKILHLLGDTWDTTVDNKEAMLLMSKQREINFAPGSQYAYSNSGYMMLSEIIQRISKMSMAEFVHQNIFKVLGMSNSQIYQNATEVIKNRAVGYTERGAGFEREHYFNFTATGDGGVCTTIGDFFKWSENLNHSKIGGKHFKERMLTSGILNNGDTLIYAAGLIKNEFFGLRTIGHDGSWGGFRSVYLHFPDQDASFVIFSNNASVNVWSHLRELVPIVLAEEIASISSPESTTSPQEEAQKAVILTPNQLEAHEGFYFNEINGYSRKILVQDDTLIYDRLNGRQTRLVPIDEHTFQFLNAPDVTLRFNMGATGKRGLTLSIRDDPPILMSYYDPISPAEIDLSNYEGIYYCDEIGVEYNLKPSGQGLSVHVGTRELESFQPVMKHIFAEEHTGYLKFEFDHLQKVKSFTINDELARNIKFEKLN